MGRVGGETVSDRPPIDLSPEGIPRLREVCKAAEHPHAYLARLELARAFPALLDALEQAERERDEWHARFDDSWAAMSKAVEAYIRCEELSIDERKRLITLARVKTSLYRAVKLTFAFARGYISEPWSPKNIRALTRAWLLLGERLFQFIYRLVKPRDPKSTTPFVALLVWVPRTAVI